MLTRRSFLSGLIATPAIVQAGNIWVSPRKLVVPDTGMFWKIDRIILSSPESFYVEEYWAGERGKIYREGQTVEISIATCKHGYSKAIDIASAT